LSTLEVVNSTFSGNSATYGGGAYNNGTTLTVTNSTFSGNSATNANGGGVLNKVGTLNYTSAIIANSTSGGDCVSAIAATIGTNLNNLVEDGSVSCAAALSGDPKLGPLANNGGLTQTFALLTGSPAIDAGDITTCAAIPPPATAVNSLDQRGNARLGACDVGSFEARLATIARAGANPTNAVSVDFTVTFNEPVAVIISAADFKLNSSVTGASITSVVPVFTPPTNIYTVTVNTGSGNGSIRLDILGAAGAYVGTQADATYIVDKGVAPTVPALVAPVDKALVANYTPTLDWGDSSYIMALANPWSYEVNVTDGATYNQTFNTVSGFFNSEYTFSSSAPLSQNTTYTWKVRSFNGFNQYSAWSLKRTFRTKLAQPVLNLPANTVAPMNNKRPTFDWNAVNGATSYTLQILNGATVVVTGTITAPNHTFTPLADLLPNTTYTWKVKANGLNQGDYSTPFTFKTATPPAIPALFAPANGALLASGARNMTWNASLGLPAAGSYEIQYANNGNFTGATFVSAIVAAATPTITTSIATNPGRTYYWRVRAWSGAGATGDYSSWSPVWKLNVKYVAPTLVSPINSALGVGVRPTFTWNANGNGLWTSYTITVANNAAFSVGVRTFTVAAPVTTYTIPNSLPALTAGLKYWKVRINGLYTPITSTEVSPVNTFTTP